MAGLASAGSLIISSRMRSAPDSASVRAISRKAARAVSGGGSWSGSRRSVPAGNGIMWDIDPATATVSPAPRRSRVSSAISTARRVSSTERSPSPAGPSMMRLLEKVFAVTTLAPARM